VSVSRPNESVPSVSVAALNEHSASATVSATTSSNPQAGSWQTLVASTSAEFLLVRFAMHVSHSWSAGTSLSSWRALMDLGVGAAASEVVVATVECGGLGSTSGTLFVVTEMSSIVPAVEIPAGSRLAVRMRVAGFTGVGSPTQTATGPGTAYLVDASTVL
jgi:hypothetical protein